MIKQIRASYFHNFKNAQYCALSNDPIPDYLENGDQVYIIDQGKIYYWDESSSSLFEKPTTGLPSGGTAGQVLGLDSNLNPAWMDQTAGGGGMNIVSLTGTQITQVGADNTMYMCGELTELTFTAPSVGITGIRFTSGTTPTVLTITGVTAWMFDFDPTSLEASTTYEINVLNGIGVAGWA